MAIGTTSFIANTTSGASPLVVTFVDLSTPTPTGWLWDFGDGSTATVQNPTHAYLLTGSYTVTLTTTGPDTYTPVTKTNYITVTTPSATAVSGMRVKVQGGNIIYETPDLAENINFNIRGQLNVSSDIFVGDNTTTGGMIVTATGQDLTLSPGTGGSIKLLGASVSINNVLWPTNTLTTGSFIGSTSATTLEYIPFVLGTVTSDLITSAELNTQFPTALIGQYVLGPTDTFTYIGNGQWRIFGGSTGSTLGNPMTSPDDIIIGGLAGTPTRLGVGSAGEVLSVDTSGAVVWATIPPNVPSLNIAASSTTAATNGQVVFNTPATYTPNTNQIMVYVNGMLYISGVDYNETTTTSITLVSSSTAGDLVTIIIGTVDKIQNPMTATGDMIIAGSGGTPQRLPVGSGNQILMIDPSSLQPVWQTMNATPTGPLPVNIQTTVSYTLALTDAPYSKNQTGVVVMNSSSTNDVVIPASTSVPFPIGTQIQIVQYGTGQTSVSASPGVTLNTPSTLQAKSQYSTITLTQILTDIWIVGGDIL